jgi:hypothetical protein
MNRDHLDHKIRVIEDDCRSSRVKSTRRCCLHESCTDPATNFASSILKPHRRRRFFSSALLLSNHVHNAKSSPKELITDSLGRLSLCQRSQSPECAQTCKHYSITLKTPRSATSLRLSSFKSVSRTMILSVTSVSLALSDFPRSPVLE